MLRVLSIMPLSWVHAIASLCGRLSYRINGVSAHVTRCNLALCFPDMTEAERERLVKQSLIETLKTGLELGLAWYCPVQKSLDSVRQVIGGEIIDQAIQNGRGVIVLAPHLGNWEIGGHYLSCRSATTYLYKPPTLKGLEAFMVKVRSRAGASLAPTNRKGVAQLVKALERAEIVGILPDQEPKDDGGVFAPFFGHQALTMTLVPKIAARTGALVVTMVAKRLEASKGFELIFEAVDDEVSHNDLVVATTAMNRAVEHCVLGAVAQYQWEYRRFKRQPDNTRNTLYN